MEPASTKLVHIDLVRIGDAIRHRGEFRTVGRADVKRSEFMGRTIFGDCYKLGQQLVEVAQFGGKAG